MNHATLITGASSGIGLEFAKLFAKNGHNLVLVARNEDKLNTLKNELKNKYDVQVYVYKKDLSQKDSAYDIFNYTSEKELFIDTIINNAGFGDFGKFSELDLQKQTDMVQVNIMSVMQLCHLFVNPMLEKNCGKILNVASIASFIPGPLMSTYHATKAFVLSFSEALSFELKGTGVSVMALCPGPTKTGFEEKANLENSGLFKHIKNSTAEEVAKYGYKKLQEKSIIAIPGIINKMIISPSKFTPRKIVRRVVYHILK